MGLKYDKRQGTSGIYGQLYETKLISLLLLRLTKDEEVEEFYLASNMDDVGDFDDICIKVKLKGRDRNILLLFQARHKERDNVHLRIPDNVFLKWVTSINKIHGKFVSKRKQHNFFTGELTDTDYFFILYTNAKYNFRKSLTNIKFEETIATQINSWFWLSTNDSEGQKPQYTGTDIKDLGKKALEIELRVLAERLAMFLKKTNQMNIMNDNYILKYHVILARQVVELSEIQTEVKKPNYRSLTFRNDFFTTNDKNLKIFRDSLYNALLKHPTKTKNTQKQISSPSVDSVDELISTFLSQPSALSLSPLIGAHIKYIYKHGKFVFNSKRTDEANEKLQSIHLSELTVNEAKTMAAKKILIPLKVNVPVTFGNIDLVAKNKRRITYLANFLSDLCEESKNADIITIDETISQPMFNLNGGFGSAVGNIIDYDEKTKLYKFSNDKSRLQCNAKAMMQKLEDTITNLHQYRFDIKCATLPKLTFDCTNTAEAFLNKFLVFSQQGNHAMIENIVIESNQTTCTNPQVLPLSPETIFLSYHSLVQTWWMSEEGQCLTKASNMYEKAITSITVEPQIFALQHMFFSNKGKKYLTLKFKSDAKLSEYLLKSRENNSKKFVSSTTAIISATKVIQSLKEDFVIIDLKYALRMPYDSFTALKEELTNTHKPIIFLCNIANNIICSKQSLKTLAKATENKRIILVAKYELVSNLQKSFIKINDVFVDEKQSLSDLTAKSRLEVLRNALLIFQGSRIPLHIFIKQTLIPLHYLTGIVVKNILKRGYIEIGKILSDVNYDKIKNSYITRTVIQDKSDNSDGNSDRNICDEANKTYDEQKTTRYSLERFQNISNNIVHIIAEPGMGKSTVLTHLSLKQIQTQVEQLCYNKIVTDDEAIVDREMLRFFWIVRINFLEYSEVFYKWQQAKAVLSNLDALIFLCQVIISIKYSIPLKEVENEVYLTSSTGNSWSDFEINMFLYFYNHGSVLLLFDGIDEILPQYKHNVINFLDRVKSILGNNKMWLTSRPCSIVIADLEKVLGKPYKLEHKPKI